MSDIYEESLKNMLNGKVKLKQRLDAMFQVKKT